MAIQLDDAMFQQILDTTVGPAKLEPREARGVIALAELAAAVDLHDSPEESTVLGGFERRLCERAGIDLATLHPLAVVPLYEDERIEAIAERARPLATRGSRELAYAIAYLVIVADRELAPVETRFLDDVGRALEIDPPRAAELAERAAQIVTFPRGDDAAAAPR